MKTIKKPSKIIRLPTEDKTNLWLDKVRTDDSFRYLPTFGELQNNGLLCSYQHLYITSGDEVKKGDYGILGGIIHRFTHNIGKPDKGKYLKIIATTDESLTHPKTIQYGNMLMKDLNGDGSYYVYKGETELTLSRQELINKGLLLSQIHQSFIGEYVKAGGRFAEAVLEYKDWCDYDDDNTWGGYDTPDLRLVLDQNNCVIIHPIEPKLYTKEEVERLLYNCYLEGVLNAESKENKDLLFDNWIKENL